MTFVTCCYMLGQCTMFKPHWPLSTFACKCDVHCIFQTRVTHAFNLWEAVTFVWIKFCYFRSVWFLYFWVVKTVSCLKQMDPHLQGPIPAPIGGILPFQDSFGWSLRSVQIHWENEKGALSQEPFYLQKWFTYQNLQNLASKNMEIFPTLYLYYNW